MTSASIVDSLGSILPQPGAKTAGVLSEGEDHPTFSDVMDQTSAKCGAPCSGIEAEGEAGKPAVSGKGVAEIQAANVQITSGDKTIELLAAGDVSATALALAAGGIQQAATTDATPLAEFISQKIWKTGQTAEIATVTDQPVAEAETLALSSLPKGMDFDDIAAMVGHIVTEGGARAEMTPEGVETPEIAMTMDAVDEVVTAVTTDTDVVIEAAPEIIAVEQAKDTSKPALSGAVANVVAATVAAATADDVAVDDGDKDTPLSGIVEEVTDLAARTGDDKPAKTPDAAILQPVASDTVVTIEPTDFDAAKTVSPAIAAAAGTAKTSTMTAQQTVIEPQAVTAQVADVQPVQTQTSSAAPVSAAAPQDVSQTQQTSAATAALPMRDSNWTSQLDDTISVHDFGDGQTLDIQLTPETLGRLKITMEMRDGQAMISVVTDNPEAARLFNDNQSRLADVMAKAGLTLASHDAGTGAQSGGSGENAQADGPVVTASGADTKTSTEEDVIMKVGGEQPQINVVA